MDNNLPPSDVSAIGDDDRDLEVGQKVGEYVVEAKIGEGGFGTVFRANHPLIGKLAAIKVLRRQYSAQAEMVSRFVAEARAVNQIRHRNIIDIFSFNKLEDGRAYYVMEYLEGQPLDEYLNAAGRIPLVDAIPILRAIARALDAAHAKGIAHRDLKPENIFLAREADGTIFPKLLDFGIAKLLGGSGGGAMHKTRTGAPIGTPYYMSPEQCRGRDVDHRTDIYAFGIVAYKLLTGEVPFDGEDYMDILLKQMGEPPPLPSSKNPELPPAVDQGILWMLQKDPAARPPNLVAAVRSLEDAAAAAGLAVPMTTSTAVHAATGARLGTAQTPSGVTPLPVTPPHFASAATIDARSLSDAAPGAAPRAAAADDDLVPPRSKAPIVVLALGVAVALGAGVFFVLGNNKADKPEATPSAPAQVPPATGLAAARPEPAVTPAVTSIDAGVAVAPSVVTITLKGAPAGTNVLGPGGRLLGTAPGALQLDRSETPLILTLQADGYNNGSATVIPSEDRVVSVDLQKKRSGAGKAAKKCPPGEKCGKGGGDRNAIEDPFKR